MNIDLHTHTIASDGTCSPTEVVKLALQKNLSAIAISDHDSISGIEEAMAAVSNTPLEIIPAIELACDYNDKEIHMLGYFIDYTQDDFIGKLRELKSARFQRNLKMLEHLQKDGYHITLEQVQNGNPNAAVTRGNFAKALVDNGYANSIREAFDHFLCDHSKYYIKITHISCPEGIDMIQKAEGIPVLAHPFLYGFTIQELERLIVSLKRAGLKGLEVYHPTNDSEKRAQLKFLTDKYDLLPTGGSDFHGTNKKGIELGTGKGNMAVPYSLLQNLKNLKSKLRY